MSKRIDNKISKMRLLDIYAMDVVGTNYTISRLENSEVVYIIIVSANGGGEQLFPYELINRLDISRNGAFQYENFTYFVEDEEILWIFNNTREFPCYYDENFVYFIVNEDEKGIRDYRVFSKDSNFHKNYRQVPLVRCKYYKDSITYDYQPKSEVVWVIK